MRRILLDADTLVEFIVNRSMFQEKVEALFEIINIEGVQFYLSDLGFKKIKDITKVMNGHKASKEIFSSLKKWFEILTVTKPILEEARLLPIRDFDSSIEVSLAINSNISAIITHEIGNFYESELNICSLASFQKRENLEEIFSKETSSRPTVLDMRDQVVTLNHLYTLPSYASEESLKKNKIHQELVNSHDDVVSLSPIHNSLSSKYRELIAKSSILPIDKELMHQVSAAFATNASKSISDSLAALYPSQDSSLLKYRESLAKSSRLAIGKGLMNPVSVALATNASKSIADNLAALYPSQDSSLLKYRESLATSSRLTMSKELMNPVSVALTTSASKSISDSLAALYPSQDSSLLKYRESLAKSSRLTIGKELMNPISAALATSASKSISDSLAALYPSQDSSLLKYKESLAKSSRLAIGKGLINPVSSAFDTSVSKLISDGFSEKSQNPNQ